jgi:hypothetical protein
MFVLGSVLSRFRPRRKEIAVLLPGGVLALLIFFAANLLIIQNAAYSMPWGYCGN